MNRNWDDGLYYRIGEQLKQRLLEYLDNHDHIALFGPRKGGKSLVLDRLAATALDRDAAIRPHVCYLRCRDCGAHTPEKFAMYMGRLLGVTEGEGAADRTLAGRIGDLIAAWTSGDHRSLWVFVEDVTGFPKPIARELLVALRASIDSAATTGRVACIVTGSSEFLPLTIGLNSPYNGATPFILAGLDVPSAVSFIQRRLVGWTGPGGGRGEIARAKPRVQATDRAFELLYQATNGNTHLLQEIVSMPARHPDEFQEPEPTWSAEYVGKLIKHYTDHHLPDDYCLRIMLREIEAEPTDFTALVDIIEDGDGVVSLPGGRPHALEAIGAVICDRSGSARMFSPLVRTFFERMLSRRHIADVYACQGRWNEAWDEYKSGGEVDRTVSGPDRTWLREAVLSWQMRLLDAHWEGSSEALDHFSHGMQALFTFHRGGLYDMGRREWVAASLFGIRPDDPEELNDLATIGSSRLRYERADLKAPVGGAESSYRLVLIRERAGQEIDHLEMKELNRIVNRFWGAYTHALETEHRLTVGRLREDHLKVIEAINREMLADPFDMGRVVRRTARELVDTAHYRRIQICLVNAERTRIQAVASAIASGERDFTKPTDFAMTDWLVDIQPWVCHKKWAEYVDDCLNTSVPLQREQCIELGMKAIAVVPMSVHGEVVGTLHFELTDGRVSSREERALYDIFAGQIAVMFRQAMHLQLLEGTVDALSDEIQILDPKFHPIYRNPASVSPHSDHGAPGRGQWYAAGDPNYELKNRFPDARHLPDLSGITHDKPTMGYLVEQTVGDHTYASDLQVTRLEDFREVLTPHRADGHIGYVERIHSLSRLYRVLDNGKEWLRCDDTESTANAILDACRTEFGCPWARIYLEHTQDNHPVLKSFREIGLEQADNKEWFSNGGLTERIDEGVDTDWRRVMENGVIAIYKIVPGQTGISPANTKDGITRYTIGDQRYTARLERHGISESIEAPLFVGNRAVGLLSLGIPAQPWLTPVRWTLLKLFAEYAAIALDDKLRAEEKAVAEREKSEAMIWIFHQFRQPLTSCRLQFRLLTPDLKKLTPPYQGRPLDRIEQALTRMEEISADYQRYIREYTPMWSTADIVGALADTCEKATITYATGNVHIQFEPDVDRAVVRTDVAELQSVTDELVYNAIRAFKRMSSEDLSTSGANVRIALDTTSEPDYITIVVEDDGPGVPEETRPHLWEAKPNKSIGGVGFGLAIVKKHLDALDATIEYSSRTPRGTRFSMRVPVETLDHAEGETE